MEKDPEKIINKRIAVLDKKPYPRGQAGVIAKVIFQNLVSDPNDKRTDNQKKAMLLQVLEDASTDPATVFDGWNFRALTYLYRREDKLAKILWQRQFLLPYTWGWYRKPVRTQGNLSAHIHKSTSLLNDLFRMECLELDLFSFLEEPQQCLDTDGDTFADSLVMGSIIAYRLDQNDLAVMKRIRVIAENEPSHCCKAVLQGMLMSRMPWAHQLCGKLLQNSFSVDLTKLTASKKAENLTLKEDLIEAMEEASIQGLLHMWSIILENKLPLNNKMMEFFDFWIGLPLSKQEEPYREKILSRLYTLMVHPKSHEFVKETLDTYLRLTALGFSEMENALACAKEILAEGEYDHKTVTLYWLSQIQWPKRQVEFLEGYFPLQDPLLLSLVLDSFQELPEEVQAPELFSKLQDSLEFLPTTPRKVELPGIPEVKIILSREKALKIMVELSTKTKSWELKDILCNYVEGMTPMCQGIWVDTLSKKDLSLLQRAKLFQLVSCKDKEVRKKATKLLSKIKMTAEETISMEKLLDLDDEGVRKDVLLLLCLQDPQSLMETIKRLMGSENSRSQQGAVAIVKSIQTLSKYQGILEEAMDVTKIKRQRTGSKKKFNIVLPGSSHKVHIQEPDSPEKILGKPKKKPDFDLSDLIPDPKDLRDKLLWISRIFDKHKHLEYESEDWMGNRTKHIFGEEESAEALREYQEVNLDNLPIGPMMRKEISELFGQRELWHAGFFMVLMEYCLESEEKKHQVATVFYSWFIGKKIKIVKGVPHLEKITQYLMAALNEIDEKQVIEEVYPTVYRIYHTAESEELLQRIYDDESEREGATAFFGCQNPIMFWVYYLMLLSPESQYFDNVFRLEMAMTKKLHFLTDCYIPPDHLAKALEKEIINQEDFYALLVKKHMAGLMSDLSGWFAENEENQIQYPKTFEALTRLMKIVVEEEMNREELPSRYTILATRMETCYGAEVFASLLSRLDVGTWDRTVEGLDEDSTKSEIISYLLKNAYPMREETLESTKRVFQTAGIEATQLIFGAMFAPQWLNAVEEYLKIPGLKKAAFFFIVQLGEYYDEEVLEEIEEDLAPAIDDFIQGDIDWSWGRTSLSEVGSAVFEMLVQAASRVDSMNKINWIEINAKLC